MLQAAIDVCNELGIKIKITNGGLHDPYFAFAYYNDLKKTNADSALSFMNKYFTDQMKYVATHTVNNSNPFMQYYNRTDTLFKAYCTMNLSYINVHIKQEDNGIMIDYDYLKAIRDFIKRMSGKDLASNEIGLRFKDDSKSVTRILSACRLLRIREINWFSGDGATDNAEGFITNDRLNESGNAFKNYMIDNQ